MRPPFSFVAQEKTKRMITVYPSLAKGCCKTPDFSNSVG